VISMDGSPMVTTGNGGIDGAFTNNLGKLPYDHLL